MVAMTAGQLVLAHAQTFSRRYDAFGQDQVQLGWDIEKFGPDGYVVIHATYFVDSPYVYLTSALLAINADGEVQLENKMLGGVNSIYPGWANSSTRSGDQGYAIGGSTYGPGDVQLAAIIRYTANGDSLWLQEYGDTVHEWIGRQVRQTLDGGYILTGETTFTGYLDAFLIKTDSLGNMEWTRTYGGLGVDVSVSVDLAPDSGYFIGGQYRSPPNNKQLWVLRTGASGDTLWQRILGK